MRIRDGRGRGNRRKMAPGQDPGRARQVVTGLWALEPTAHSVYGLGG